MTSWFCPENNQGQESGFHDAGVETFRGNLNHYLAREILQNSVDAQDDKSSPVIVEFGVIDLPRNLLPGQSELVRTLKSCADYWAEDKHGSVFFKHAGMLL